MKPDTRIVEGMRTAATCSRVTLALVPGLPCCAHFNLCIMFSAHAQLKRTQWGMPITEARATPNRVWSHITYINIHDVTFFPDEHRKKEVRIVLVSEDIAKLKYVTTYIDERSQNDQFSLNRFVRRTRRKKLPTNVRMTKFVYSTENQGRLTHKQGFVLSGGVDQGMFPPPQKTCFPPKIIWQNNY